jgi:hypothetical protein
MVELASASICLHPAVPSLGGELLKPRLEAGELFRGKAADGGLKFLDAHSKKILQRRNNFDKVQSELLGLGDFFLTFRRTQTPFEKLCVVENQFDFITLASRAAVKTNHPGAIILRVWRCDALKVTKVGVC